MKILVLGSGGREHAILMKLSQSKKVSALYCLPGNAGTGLVADNVQLDLGDFDGIVNFVKKNEIDLTIVGPEAPLMEGVVDLFEEEGLKIFGPCRAAAELEGSKAYSKKVMAKYNIPTATFKVFTKFEDAFAYLKESEIPIVIKASGLAAGKGAIVCRTFQEAEKALREIMVDRIFGKAGDEVVIEEFLQGEEASVFAVSDGNYYKIMATAQDHKQIFDGDEGPNTGGMGTYAPAPVVSGEMLKQIEKEIIAPSFEAMKEEGHPYRGVLFIGLMITGKGPKVIEYNCRFGDPETQVILPLFDGDLFDLMYDSAAQGFKKNEILPQKKSHCVCVVMASGGYPGSYKKGKVITGLEDISRESDVVHAGTKYDEAKQIVTAGGRVLGLVSRGATLQAAINSAYSEVEKIKFEGRYYRTDIGLKGLKYYDD